MKSLLLVLVLFAAAAEAQIVGGSISGTVQDPNGATVAGAAVEVRQLETGATRTLTTAQDGRFFAPSVPVGHYTVKVSQEGFDPQEQSGIDLTVGQSLQLKFVLGIAKLQQQVEVDATADTVNITTQSTSGLIDERQVKELPLNGRSYDELLTLNPATVNYTSERSGGIGSSNSSVGNMFAVSGRRPQDNLFLLNGIEYTGASLINVTPGGTSGQLLGVDAVKRIQRGERHLRRQLRQARRRAGQHRDHLGHQAICTARPSNSCATACSMRAIISTRESIPPFQRNQFGGSLGGPLRKDKLFLFGNYEGFRQSVGAQHRHVRARRAGAAGISSR